MVSHVVPEVLCCGFEIGIAAFEFGDSLESDKLRYLGVSVLTIEEGAAVRRKRALHTVHLMGVVIALGCVEIFLVAEDMVSVSNSFVHSAVLPSEHVLHIVV